MHSVERKPEEVIIRFDAGTVTGPKHRRKSISRGKKGHPMNWNLAAIGPTQRRASSPHSVGSMAVKVGRQTPARTHGIVASALLTAWQSLKFRERRRTESSALRFGAGRKRPRMSVQQRDPVHERTLRRWLPWLCLKGVELADAREILKVLLGIDARELSARELAAFQRDWTREFEQWQVRDLAGRQYDCFWMAGVTVPTRIEPGGPSILVVFGADRHSSPELVGLRAGRPESGKDWGNLLADLKRRGVSNGPKLAVGDVAQGALRALRAEFGQTGIQIGWRRESLNRLGVIPSDRRSNARSQANALFAAAKKADTGGDVNRIAGRCGAVGCEASEHSRQARDQLLTSHGSSDSQWERLRSFEVIDEVFATVRTETPMANRNLDPETALAMAYQVVLSAHQDDRNHHDGPSIL